MGERSPFSKNKKITFINNQMQLTRNNEIWSVSNRLIANRETIKQRIIPDAMYIGGEEKPRLTKPKITNIRSIKIDILIKEPIICF